MKNPIHVIVPTVVDPENPTIELSLKIDLQDYPAVQSKNETISIIDKAGNLRNFEEIQTEYAKKAISLTGSKAAAEKPSGISRQTLAKWENQS